jgi:penicillin-binding protein 1A
MSEEGAGGSSDQERGGGGPRLFNWPRPGGPRRPGPPRTLWQSILYWTAVGGIWAAIAVIAAIAVLAQGLPDTSKLYQIKKQPSITYLDRSGALIAVRGSQYAPPVDLDSLPAYVPGAFVAIEDRQFYHHLGFNPWGILRSELYNITHPHGPLRGGSTITQQLARNLFLTPAQNMHRKAQELVLALWLETKFSKKQILALYLNRVYFGAGAYGIEAASQRYFNKPASQLTLGEAALLAGMLKAPSRYSPISDVARAERRATIVLDEMVQNHNITAEQRDDAFRHPVRISSVLAAQRGQYFVDWVDAQVRQMVGQPQEDLVVETTLDLPIQAAAERTTSQGVATEGVPRGIQQAALVSLDGEGRVRAYVGGVNYADSQFDRVSQAKRQAGSSFKPFVYLTAMEQGHTPYEEAVDEPTTIGNWEVHDFEKRYLGRMSLATALAQSINTVAAKLGQQVGTGVVAATAHRLGVNSTIQTDPSMALGAVEVSPLEMAGAYDAFANGGFRVNPYGIERIRSADGKMLYDHAQHPTPRTQVIGAPGLQYMDMMMRGVVSGGTGTAARVPGYDLAGKTGTTSDYRDAWFIGFTGGFVTAIWTGRDDNTPMRKVTGGSVPALLWREYMSQALPRLNVSAIPGGPAPPPSPAQTGDLDNLLSSLGMGGVNGEGDPVGPTQPPPQQPPARPEPAPSNDDLY